MPIVMTIADTPIETTLLALGGVLACLGIMGYAIHQCVPAIKERLRMRYHRKCERRRVREYKRRWTA